MTGREGAHSAAAEVAETHSAVVILIGDHAYKLKKPVDLGFLDFTRRAQREEACHREVALNRRLCPDVYLGVADVNGPDGAPCDHLVVMRRMPAERRLSSLVRAGEPVRDHLWDLAHLIAAFHARSPRSEAADAAAGAEGTRSRWHENTESLRSDGAGVVDRRLVDWVDRAAGRYIDGRAPLFAARVDEGRSVDGHGDLLADDIFCLADGPRVLDCLDFADRFRLGDGLSDAAFLAMDLERLGRPDLGWWFLEAYGEHRADSWPRSLAHHHIAYRAQVRAKVAALRAGQGGEGAAAEAARLLDQTARHLDAARVRLVLVGGLPGTGKSTVAAGVADALGGVLLRSDEVRKEMHGLDPSAPAPAAFGGGLYTPDATERTYTAMLSRARIALARGETVVLDATFTAARWRDQARSVAEHTCADLVEIRCEAPADLATARMLERAAAGGDPSDATPAIAEALAATADPWPQATVVDTSGPPPASVEVAVAAVATATPDPLPDPGGTA